SRIPSGNNVRKGAAVGSRRIPFRVYAASLLVVLLGASAAAQNDGRATRSNVAIDNFGCINENYFRGAQPKGRDYADLATLGVKTVIDLTADGNLDEPAMVRDAGMTFYRIPLTTESRPSSEAIAQFLTLVNDSANGPIYVHCQGGRHRTGVMTAVYRMTQDGWTADRA